MRERERERERERVNECVNKNDYKDDIHECFMQLRHTHKYIKLWRESEGGWGGGV